MNNQSNQQIAYLSNQQSIAIADMVDVIYGKIAKQKRAAAKLQCEIMEIATISVVSVSALIYLVN